MTNVSGNTRRKFSTGALMFNLASKALARNPRVLRNVPNHPKVTVLLPIQFLTVSANSPKTLFFLASCCYFIQVPPYEGLTAGGEWGWEYQVSEWGVRFTFGVGSICFLVAAILAFPELLSD